jgi:4-amino-4-deoxy-L-arabinose transferase-like glycosyltransferase
MLNTWFHSSVFMKTLAVALIVVALAGIALSAFPNLGTRSFGTRGNFNNTQISQQNPNQSFGFGGISTLLRIGLWVLVLVIAILLLREPKKKK